MPACAATGRLREGRWLQPRSRSHVQGRHGLAAHGAADQPDDDHRRDDVRRSARCRDASASCSASVSCLSALPPVAVNTPAARIGKPMRSSTSTGTCASPRLPGAADKTELETFVSELASTPLDHSKPLWQFHVVENYRGGSVLVARIHHCYADGLALVQVMLSLTDTAPHPKSAREARQDLAQARSRRRAGTAARADPGRLAEAPCRSARRSGKRSPAMIADPEVAAEFAHEGSEITRELARRCTLADDPTTCVQGPARRHQARRLGRAAAARRSEDARSRARLHGQRRAARLRGRRAARLPARSRRRSRRPDHPRDRAGQPAPARTCEEARQPLRPGVPRSADRRSRIRCAGSNASPPACAN